jgi:peptide/nickel transport system permease protein
MNIKAHIQELKKGMAPTIREIKFSISRLKKSPLSIIGITLITFFIILALIAPILAPPTSRDPFQIPRDGWKSEPQPPSAKHIFGTLPGQYDIYYGIIWGSRTAFRIGVYVVAAALFIGLIIGIISGYYGGIMDELLMRFTDIILAFPGLILAMALVTALGKSLDNVLLALVLVGWPGYARVIRGEVLRVKQEEYVEAARAAGCSDLRIIFKHIIPNAIYPILIMASLDIGSIVLTAAGLSFLGLGSGEGFADWGQMIGTARAYIGATTINKYWFIYTIPGIFIFLFVLGWNLLGDAFRDVLDPTLRRR